MGRRSQAEGEGPEDRSLTRARTAGDEGVRSDGQRPGVTVFQATHDDSVDVGRAIRPRTVSGERLRECVAHSERHEHFVDSVWFDPDPRGTCSHPQMLAGALDVFDGLSHERAKPQLDPGTVC